MNQQFINDLAERVLKSTSLKPVGETWISFDGTIPFGGIPFLGGSYSKELYKDLYAYAKAKGKVITEEEWQKKNKEQNGNVPFYSDVNETEFRVPRINGYFKGSDSIGETGKYIPEGIPNLKGWFTGGYTQLAEASGVFFNSTDKYSEYGFQDRSQSNYRVGFDANKFNKVFGASEHVTPETIQVLVGVYAFGTISNIGNTDVGQLATEVTNLTNKINGVGDLIEQSKPNAYITETWSGDKAWYRLYSDGWVEQGGQGVEPNQNNAHYQVTFPKPFIKLPDTVLANNSYRAKPDYTGVGVDTVTTTSFWIGTGAYGGNEYRWYACGYYK